MRLIRAALLCGAVLVAATAWSEPTVQLTVDSLSPAGPYTPGQQVTVKGTVAYAQLDRPWGGGGRMTTQTRHSANVALEYMRTVDDDWPEVPELKAARGNLLVADGTEWAPFEQKHGGASQIWSTPVNPPARTERTDPMRHSDQLPFEATFTVPDECVAIRLRATLDMTVGANWFVSWYFYDYQPLDLEVPGVEHIRVTCERKPYVTRTRTVVVTEDTDKVTISGKVTDPRWQPIHRALVTASGAGGMGQAFTAKDGTYSIELTLSDPQVIATRAGTGNLKTAAKTCDFRLSAPVDLIIIEYTIDAPGYKRKTGKFALRAPMDTRIVWVHGLIGHKDQDSLANAKKGYLAAFHRVDGGTVRLKGPGGQNVFDFHWGSLTGYVPIREKGNGEVSTRRLFLLEPDPTAGTAATAAADPQDPENLDGFEKQLKVIWEQADEDLRKLWLRMGLLIALKKDIEAVTSGGYSGTPDNVRKYLDRWDNGGYQGKMYNALWTLQESVMLMPHASLSTAADMETHAKNAQKLYSQLKGQTLTPNQGAGPLQAMVQNIIYKEELGLSWDTP
jgi:hypothetical protein